MLIYKIITFKIFTDNKIIQLKYIKNQIIKERGQKMNKKDAIKNRTSEPIYISINEVMGRFSIGRVTAEKIGKQTSGVVKVGKNKLYNVEKFKAYFETLENVNN